MSELNRLSAAEAARRIAARTITSEALVRDCLDRIRERDGKVQAWVHCDPDAALAQARAIDKAGAKGLLAGVPVAFKDVIDTFDMPTQYNSPIYRDYRPRIDAACAAMVRHAGGVVLGKTVTTEFASRKPGPTRNPHNLDHTPGRILERLGRVGRRLHGAARVRHADRRLEHPAGGVLRDRRLQAELRHDQSRGFEVARRIARHDRPLRRSSKSQSKPPRCGSSTAAKAEELSTSRST